MDNSSVIKLDESNFDREVTQDGKPVIVDFWAEWCGPCKMIAPLLDEIAREKADAVKVAKVNVDENQSLSLKYQYPRDSGTALFQERPTARSNHGSHKQEGLVKSNRSAGLRNSSKISKGARTSAGSSQPLAMATTWQMSPARPGPLEADL